MDQIFSFRTAKQKIIIISKVEKLYAAFMGLKKAYDIFDWTALWDVSKLYGVGGKLVSAIKSFL